MALSRALLYTVVVGTDSHTFAHQTRDAQSNALLIYAHEYVADTLLDQVYLEEAEDGAPVKKAQVAIPGGHKLAASLWLSLEGESAFSGCCVNALHLLMAAEAPAAGMLKVLLCHILLRP